MIDPGFARGLLARYGSPLYAYDGSEPDRCVRGLAAVLPAGARILYSAKANPLPAMLRLLRGAGAGAEVCSPGELATALSAGFPAGGLLYGGPGKTEHELRLALYAGVGTFSCESPADHERLRRMNAEAGREVDVLFRVNPAPRAGSGLVMAGTSSQFGMDPEVLRELLLRDGPGTGGLRVRGLHVYYGTQMQGTASLLAAAEATLDTLADTFAAAGVEPSVVDFGGGFPWPFARDEPAPDLRGLREGLEELFRRRGFRGKAWFESGRYLAASSGVLLTTVLDVKESRGRRFVVVDAGINHFGGMAGLGRIHIPRAGFQRLGGAEGTGAADVVGPLCTPLDVLARGAPLGEVAPGDVLAVPNVGAYGLTASLVAFLSRTPPAEVVHRDGRVEEVHRLRAGHERLPTPPEETRSLQLATQQEAS